MLKATALLATFVIASTFSFAQKYFHSDYYWEKAPKIYVPTEEEKKSDLVIVSEKKVIEVAYESDGQAVIYETIHNIYHVNSTKAIDGVNKGYMAMGSILEEIDLKARCITSENKVIPFNKSSIKSVDNLEGAGPYKIFAIDGVDAGCDVEILYVNKKQMFSYAYYYVQSRSPVAHYETHIISPKNLIFETKSYNGLENFKSDVSDSTKNHLSLVQKNIVGIDNEKYSADKANNMAFIFQLTYNTDKKKSRFYTWDIISRDFYTSLYTIEKNEGKAIEKLISKAKIGSQATEFEKLQALDSYLKTTYEINDAYDVPLIKGIEDKKLSEINVLKFYLSALKSLQINFELVITTKRDAFKFDPKFASYIYTKEFLLYFPSVNKYVSPLSLFSRPGFPEPDLLNNEGLFIKEINIGDISSSSAKTKSISVTDYKDSYHNFEINAQLNFDNKTARLNVTEFLFGYSAYYVQPIYRYLKAEQKEEIHKNYQLSENTEGVKNFEVLNTEEADVFKKPMVVKFTSEQNDFLENAGNKFIFKVGLLIGPQAELYQDDKRKTPGQMNFTHYLKRTLEINIPDGYEPSNLNDIIIDKTCSLDGKEVASFKSSYEVKDKKIIVSVYEDYKVVDYPLSVFNDFKAVINAAADFNKKSIVFEKR